MHPLLEKLPEKLKAKLQKKKMPNFVQPMLATLTNNYFSDKDWIYERKLDGERCLMFKNKDKFFLKSRNDKRLDTTYPELIKALGTLQVDQIILDGEIVSFKGKLTSFEKLQLRLGVQNPTKDLIKKVKIYIYIFDIIYLDGYDLTHLPLIKRKSILKKAVKFQGALRYVIHRNEKGLEAFRIACHKNWEGVIAKNRYSTYVHERSKNWLKFKCIQQQELVIGGYTDPQRSRIGFGALLVGYYKNNKFIYAGKVGTGFSDSFLEGFSTKLKKIAIDKNPFANKEDVDTDAHFVKPYYVGEFRFEEWTRDNLLRQPRFMGLREDKTARDVVQEEPQNIIPPKLKS